MCVAAVSPTVQVSKHGHHNALAPLTCPVTEVFSMQRACSKTTGDHGKPRRLLSFITLTVQSHVNSAWDDTISQPGSSETTLCAI